MAIVVSQECSFPVESRINKPSYKYCLKLYLRMGLAFIRGSPYKRNQELLEKPINLRRSTLPEAGIENILFSVFHGKPIETSEVLNSSGYMEKHYLKKSGVFIYKCLLSRIFYQSCWRFTAILSFVFQIRHFTSVRTLLEN